MRRNPVPFVFRKFITIEDWKNIYVEDKKALKDICSLQTKFRKYYKNINIVENNYEDEHNYLYH